MDGDDDDNGDVDDDNDYGDDDDDDGDDDGEPAGKSSLQGGELVPYAGQQVHLQGLAEGHLWYDHNHH